MSDGIYIHKKITMWHFRSSSISKMFENVECILAFRVYFVLYIDILNIIFGVFVFFGIYEVEKCDCLQKCTTSVINSRTKYCGGYVWDF